MTLPKNSNPIEAFEEESKTDASDPVQLEIIPPPETEKWKPVRDDFNFCRLALFVAGDKHQDRFRNIEQKYKVEIAGKQLEATWEVRHDPILGLPGGFDHDVWIGLCEIVTEITCGNKLPIPDAIPINGHREFLRRLGKSGGGKYQAMFKEAIKRLTLTTFVTRRAFNCPSSGGYLESIEAHHLLSACAFKGEPDGKGGVHETTWVRLGEYIKKNLESGYIALLDVKYIRSLRGDISKQLYRYLSYRLWLAAQRGRDFTTVNWKELAEYLAVTGWTSLWRAKQRLEPAIAELKTRQYIDVTSDWQGDIFIFRAGDKFIDELRARLKAKEHYLAWVKGKPVVKQLQLLSFTKQPPSNDAPPNDAEERESVLIRQATRIAVFNQTPDAKLLAKHNWSPDDAISLAAQIKSHTP